MQLGFSFCGAGMIGGKRRSLLKQLWKEHQELNPSPSSTSASTTSHHHSRDRTLAAKAELKALAKRLSDRQLETLVQAIEGSLCSPVACVLVSRTDVPLPGGARVAPHVVACRLWRWPAVEDARRLRVLPICSTAAYCSSSTPSSSPSSSPSPSSARSDSDACVCCCNPFHWSTAIPEDISESPSRSLSGDLLDSVSLNSDNDGSYRRWQSPWCHLVYREYKHHVGGFFSIYSDWTRVFQELFHGDGMCLSLIQKPTTNRPVDRTRAKIGRGILLSRQDDSVWMYNCSEHPVFVSSPSFVGGVVQATGKFAVRRISPGCSLKVYDCVVVDRMVSLSSGSATQEGPVLLDSIHVSFAKGWGRQYTRQFITSCPCWMELLLRRK